MDWSSRGLTELDAMAAHMADRIERIHPTGAIHLLGICFGGVLGFASARALQARGRRVETLVVVDTPAPGEANQIIELQGEVADGPETHDPGVEDRLALGRVHLDALRRYRPSPGLEVRIDLVYAEGTGKPVDRDRRLGWAALTAGGLRIHPASATRDKLVSAHLAPLAELVRDRMGPRLIQGLDRAGLAAYLPDHRLARRADGHEEVTGAGSAPHGVLAEGGRGFVERVAHRSGRLFIDGWALHPRLPEPGDRVLLFLGDRLAARARVGIPRTDVAARLGNPAVMDCGFSAEIELQATDRADGQPLRAFALGDGEAVELAALGPSPWIRSRSLTARVRAAMRQVTGA